MDLSHASVVSAGSGAGGGPMTIAQIVGVANPPPMPPSDAAAANLPPNYERCVLAGMAASLQVVCVA
jgi:hypothetical protein